MKKKFTLLFITMLLVSNFCLANEMNTNNCEKKQKMVCGIELKKPLRLNIGCEKSEVNVTNKEKTAIDIINKNEVSIFRLDLLKIFQIRIF